MNLRAIIEVSIIKNDRPYVLHLPVGAPFEECHEVMKELNEAVVLLDNQAKEQAKAAAEQTTNEVVDAVPVAPEITE